jgi:hypothetical protein
MNIDTTLGKVETLCSRLEETLEDLQRLAAAKRRPFLPLADAPPNAGKPWSAQDDEQLGRLILSGNSVADLALLFGRTKNGIRVRLLKLGLTESQGAAA